MDNYIIYTEDVLKFATNLALNLWSFYILIVGQISLNWNNRALFLCKTAFLSEFLEELLHNLTKVCAISYIYYKRMSVGELVGLYAHSYHIVKISV